LEVFKMGQTRTGTWAFGADLRFQSVVEQPVERHDAKAFVEENIETLLLLNLDHVLPGAELLLGRKTLNDWGGADIEAIDALGCRHYFEVKNRASHHEVVEQSLGYALRTVREPQIGLLLDQDKDQRRLSLACRVAAFWTGERVDKVPKQGGGPADRLERLLQRLTGEHPKEPFLSAADLLAARQAASRRERFPRSLPVARDLDVHLVLRNAQLSQDEQDLIYPLQTRGFRCSILEFKVKRTGKIAGLATFNEWRLVQNGAEPSPMSIGLVLAATSEGCRPQPTAALNWSIKSLANQAVGTLQKCYGPQLSLHVEPHAISIGVSHMTFATDDWDGTAVAGEPWILQRMDRWYGELCARFGDAVIRRKKTTKRASITLPLTEQCYQSHIERIRVAIGEFISCFDRTSGRL
jgi:hypothetical protein